MSDKAREMADLVEFFKVSGRMPAATAEKVPAAKATMPPRSSSGPRAKTATGAKAKPAYAKPVLDSPPSIDEDEWEEF